jgi:hypothetical protein
MIRLFLFALVCLLGCDQLVEACHGGASGSNRRQERRQSRRSGAGGCSGVAEGYGGCSGASGYGAVGCSGGAASVGYSRTTTTTISPHGTVPAQVVPAPAPTSPDGPAATVVPSVGPPYAVNPGAYSSTSYVYPNTVSRGRTDYGRAGTGVLRRNTRRNYVNSY